MTPGLPGSGRFYAAPLSMKFHSFLNVLKGDMSLLGPRPMMLDQIELYGPTLDVYLSMKPGDFGQMASVGTQ